jgi:3-hydroxyisobutyrate dehydrogenase-like beta-hydroxyacid dehydrogenase
MHHTGCPPSAACFFCLHSFIEQTEQQTRPFGVPVPATENLAFLGLGQMGAPIARLLLAQGHNVTLWNRDRGKADAIQSANSRIAASPADAVGNASIVFTMLADDAATEAVLFGDPEHSGVSHGFLDALQPGAIHVTLSTISVALARRVTAVHQERGQHHVAAPVFGRPAVAEAGKLWIVTSGSDETLSRVHPVLASVSRGITVVSREPWQAHALKLGGNFTITSMIQTLSEAFVYAESQGIPPALFHQAINSALFQSTLYENYGKTILNPPQHPGATVSLGIKDTRLVREAAAEAGIHLRLADYFADVLNRAKEAGFADEDWAVGQYRIAQSDAPRHAKKD